MAANDMKPKEWVAPKAESKYSVLCDSCIDREDGSIVTHVDVGSEAEIRASRRLATGLRNKHVDYGCVPLERRIGFRTYVLNIALKAVYPIRRFSKLLLQYINCGRAHSGDVSSNSQTNV